MGRRRKNWSIICRIIIMKLRSLLTKQLQQEESGGVAAVWHTPEELEEEPANKPKKSNTIILITNQLR